MALDRLTKVDGGGISTTSDYRVGVITASKFVGPIDGVVTGTLTGTATTAVNAQGLIGTPDIVVGIITASSANFSGNVSIGGTLTYEDVTNIDSVGIITARDGIDCNADLDVDGHTNLDNVSVAGVTTFTDDVYFDGATSGRDIVFDRSDNQLEFAPNAKIRMGGSFPLTIYNNTNSYITQQYQAALFIESKDVQIYGSGGGYNAPIFIARNGIVELGYEPSGGNLSTQLKTSAKGITVGTGVTIETNGQATFVGVVTFGSGSTTIDNNVVNVGTALTLGHTQGVQFHTQNLHSRGFEVNQINASGIITASSFRGPSGGTATFQDIDVDGHTNLDNVSIAGVTTFTQKINLSDNFIRNCRGFNTGNEQARIVVKAGDNSVGGGLRIVEYYNDDTTLFSTEIANFYTNGIELKEATTVSGNLTITENIVHAGDTDTRMRFSNDDTITFETAGGNRLHIDSNGRVYMGAVTSSTGYGNQVLITGTLGLTGNGSNVGMHFHRSGGDTEGYIGIGPWAVTGGSDNDFGFAAKGDLIFGTSSNTWSQKFMIGDNGYSKFGTGTARATLDIKQGGNSWEDALLIQHDNANTGWNIHAERQDSALWFGYNSNTAAALADQTAHQKFILRSDGKVIIGTNYTGGTLSVTGNIITDDGTNARITIQADGTSTNQIASTTTGFGSYCNMSYQAADHIFRYGGTERLRITAGGVVKIGGDVSNASADVGTVTKLTIKQHTNTHEGGIYLERSGERRGWYMYVGGAGGYNDALCLTTNQLGTDTNVLAIDRGNRLAKLGGDVIIDSTNNGYGGLRIYDDSSGDYNVNYIAGRNQGATAHVFKRSGRTQNQSPWIDATSYEIARLTSGRGISFNGDTDTSLGHHSTDHLKIKTGDKDVAHFDNRKVLIAPKLNTKAFVFSSCNNRWASQRSVLKFYMEFYTGNSSATYHFMRMISQPDWSFDDVTIKQTRYQYSPDGSDHATRRYYTYYSSHGEQIINYNQQAGGSGTSAANWITKRTDFGPGGAHKIHEAANGGYYRDLWGSDYSIGLGNYIGVKLEITVHNTVGVYDTGTYATASDFYPAAYGGQATQSAADAHTNGRGVWFNTVANGTGSGSAPVLGIHQNNAYGWSTGTNFFDVSL